MVQGNIFKGHTTSATYGWGQRSNVNLAMIEYGYSMDEDGYLFPDIIVEKSIPPDFPTPCTCLKCAFETKCMCRVLKIAVIFANARETRNNVKIRIPFLKSEESS